MTDDRKAQLALIAAVVILFLLLRRHAGATGGPTTIINNAVPAITIAGPTINTYELSGLPPINFTPFQDAGMTFTKPGQYYDSFNLPDANYPGVTITVPALTGGSDDFDWMNTTDLMCGCQSGYQPQVYVKVYEPAPPPIIQYGYVDKIRSYPTATNQPSPVKTKKIYTSA